MGAHQSPMFYQLFLYVICDKGWLMLSILLDWWTFGLNIHGQGQWVGKYKRHFKSLRNYLIKGRKTFYLYQRDESIVGAPPDHRSVCMLFCLTAITPRWSPTVQYCNIRQTDGSKIVRFDHMVALYFRRFHLRTPDWCRYDLAAQNVSLSGMGGEIQFFIKIPISIHVILLHLHED